MSALQTALAPVEGWKYTGEQEAGVNRAKTYFQGSDAGILCGFFVNSINEWKLAQPRVLIISQTMLYRATYSHKTGKIVSPPPPALPRPPPLPCSSAPSPPLRAAALLLADCSPRPRRARTSTRSSR